MKIKNVFYGILGIAVLAGVIYGVDKVDQRKTEATVYVVYQNEGVMFETEDGNTWLIETDDTENIDCGDKYILTFKMYENTNIYDDAIVDYKPIVE